MPFGIEFQCAGGEQGRNTKQEGELGGFPARDTECDGGQDCGARTGKPGKKCGRELGKSDCESNSPTDLACPFFILFPLFDQNDEQPPDEGGPGDGSGFVGQFEFHFVEDKTSSGSDSKG